MPEPESLGKAANGNTFRIAALSDLHYTKSSKGQLLPLIAQACEAADVLAICGDLTDYGLPEEAAVLAEDIRAAVTKPVLAVLGNHDFESNHTAEVLEILEGVGIKFLDGDSQVIEGVGFAGVPGFGGGFAPQILNSWGEPIIKSFVQEAVDHALRLERALARLETETTIVLLHYAPVRATVIGEHPEVFPFLGTTRLEEPINRYKVAAVFHGHAHNGTFQAKTAAGIDVYNVALPVLRKSFPDRPSFHLFEVPRAESNAESGAKKSGDQASETRML